MGPCVLGVGSNLCLLSLALHPLPLSAAVVAGIRQREVHTHQALTCPVVSEVARGSVRPRVRRHRTELARVGGQRCSVTVLSGLGDTGGSDVFSGTLCGHRRSGAVR